MPTTGCRITPASPRPENPYYYPGFTLGGPVQLPFTDFNKKRDKLFFFTGYQYFYQVLDTGLLRATVPTAGERSGDFSPAEIAEGRQHHRLRLGARRRSTPRPLALYPGGIIPENRDRSEHAGADEALPAPNANPNANGGYNWVDDLHFNQNNFQWMSRVDYSISDNTKLFVRYNLQREVQLFPIGLWSAATTAAAALPDADRRARTARTPSPRR